MMMMMMMTTARASGPAVLGVVATFNKSQRLSRLCSKTTEQKQFSDNRSCVRDVIRRPCLIDAPAAHEPHRQAIASSRLAPSTVPAFQ
jgi:hypothetical protein